MTPAKKLELLLTAVNVSDKLPDVDREPSFRMMVDFLRRKQTGFNEFQSGLMEPNQVVIVETGCVRQENDFTAGYSTVIFDTLLQDMGQGILFSIDITEKHVQLAKRLTSWSGTGIICNDSVSELWGWDTPIDLLFLDSFDINHRDQHPSALHHLMELMLALPHLRRPAMVAVDDNFSGEYRPVANRYSASKGAYIRQFFKQIGIKPVLDLHQTIWMVT